jgi:hypothetical protein
MAVVLVEIDCNRVSCGRCRWWRSSNCERWCELFDVHLDHSQRGTPRRAKVCQKSERRPLEPPDSSLA